MRNLHVSLVTIALSGSLLVGSVIPAFAQNYGGHGLIRDVNNMQNQASKAATRQQNDLQHIIQTSDTLITNRINSLNRLTTRVQNDSRLSASEKTTLSSDIQTDSSGLTTLKAKIDADTDVTTARADEKQIITSYYIYAMLEPKLRLLIVLNNLQMVTANLQALVPQVQNLINTLQSQGKNVSPLQTLLNDVTSQLQTITTTLTNDTNSIQNVSVTTQTPSTVFTQIHQDISQIVRSGFAKVQSDFSQMRPLFRQLILPNSNPTGTASQTITPTMTPAVSTTPTQ